MALGGGTFMTQNKKLPGTYVNVISNQTGGVNLSDRGVAAMALTLDWGRDGEVFEVTSEDFQKRSMELFGYDYGHPKVKGLRDLFKNTKTLYAYRLNSGEKAKNQFITAKCSGVRGNDFKLTIQNSVDNENLFDVSLYLDDALLISQTVETPDELQNNPYVEWNDGAELEVTAGTPLIGGANKGDVTVAEYQKFLDLIESYHFNALGVVTDNEAVNDLVAEHCKRLRDDVGVKFQVVLYNTSADYEGVMNVTTTVTDKGESPASMVYWFTGAEAGCPINESITNKKYDGSFTPKTDLTQHQLEKAIDNGELVLHKVGSENRVLTDINSLVTTTAYKGDIFKSNRTIRVVDELAMASATLFNTKYLGKFPNDHSGRVSLWNDMVDIRKKMQQIRAIEEFTSEDVQVERGDHKKAVLLTETITIVDTMEQLYMTTTVR